MRKTKVYWFRTVFLLAVLLAGLAPGLASAQEGREVKVTVTGKDTGEALPGANVTVKGTNRGASADINGVASLNTSPTDVLVVSFIGYEAQEVAVGNRSLLTVALASSDEALGEVVVVGYGTQRKMNLTGAIATIDSKAIENRPVTNLATAMQGTAPGLIVQRTTGQPGNEGISIQVRGATSANGNIDPLLLVDGVIAPISVLQTINPNDVDNISILKDAAAAAIYGAQAAGGVILVTTKKGKAGKSVFQYSNIIGTNLFMDKPQKVSLLEEALMSNESFKNAGLGKAFSDSEIEFIKSGQGYYLNPADTNDYVYLNANDNADLILRKKTTMQTHNFSVRGGTQRMNYLLSLGYYGQEGIFRVGPDRYDRYNGRVNVGAELTKHISVETRLGYTHTAQDAPQRSIGDLMGWTHRYRNRWPIFTPEGRLNHQGAGTSSGSPYFYLQDGGFNNTRRNNFDGVVTLKVANVVKGLQLRAILGGQYSAVKNDIFARTITLWNRVRPALTLNPTNSYDVRQTAITNMNIQYLADYNVKFGEHHHVDLMAGYQYEDYRNDYTTNLVQNLVNNDLPVLTLGSDATRRASQVINTYASQSVFGRVTYRYSNRYILEGTVRSDESSRLAPGLRTKIFPSVSAAWNISNEAWMPQVDAISGIKFRGSWGSMGSSIGNVIGNYDYVNRLTRGDALVLGASEARQAYYFQNVVPSASLTWEEIRTSNAGIDVELFQNRLQLSADYYVKHNINMLTPFQVPDAFGVAAPRVNNGKLKSWGWELSANYRGKAGEVGYNIGGNLSDNQNKLLEYAGQRVVSNGRVAILEGYPLNTMWGFQTDGYIQTEEQLENAPFFNTRTALGDVKYVDQNGDKVMNFGRGTPDDSGDLIYLGSDQPRLNYGITGNGSICPSFSRGLESDRSLPIST
jgi:TonB-linked SusC/RagA family outer membrane protein